MTDTDDAILKTVRRQFLRAQIVSLFWSVIQDRKRRLPGGYSMQMLANALGVHKSAVSRWFNNNPNLETDTIADLAGALGLELRITATDRKTGQSYTPQGPEQIFTMAKCSSDGFFGDAAIETFSPQPNIANDANRIAVGATGS